MSENYLITGYWGEPHVTAENDRGINAAIFGTGRFVLPVGKQFQAEYIGNNTIRVYDGKLVDNGAAAGIPAGKYVDLLISEAGQGMNRNDVIVFQYKKDATTLVESGSFIVVKGAETTGTAEDPVLAQSDLLSDTAILDQMALWRVPVSTATISDPVRLFDVSKNLANAGGEQVVEATSTDGISYTATVENVHKLYAGLRITIIPNKESSAVSPSLNVNGIGGNYIRRRLSSNTAITTLSDDLDWMAANKPITLQYDGKYWITDLPKTNAIDLYGIVPINRGGTGSGKGATGLKNLLADGAMVLSSFQFGTALPEAGNPGKIFFKMPTGTTGGGVYIDTGSEMVCVCGS